VPFNNKANILTDNLAERQRTRAPAVLDQPAPNMAGKYRQHPTAQASQNLPAPYATTL
jgi:hypothetical protein